MCLFLDAFRNCEPFLSAVMDNQPHTLNCSSFPDSTDPAVCVDEPATTTAATTTNPGKYDGPTHVCVIPIGKGADL